MSGKFFYLCCVIIILCIGIFLFSPRSLESEFLARLDRASKEHKIFYLEDITPFTWEKACFVGPYTSQEDVQNKIGNDYPLQPLDTNDDGIAYIIFGLSNKQPLPIKVSRRFFDANQRAKCLIYKATEKNSLNYRN